MSKLWVFGDSFSDNTSCNLGDDYYDAYPNPEQPTWNNLLAKHLNLEIINKAKGGESNEYIQYTLQKFWNEIEENDIVIISTTAPTRIPIFINRDDKTFLGTAIPEFRNENIWQQFKKDWSLNDQNKIRETVIDFVYYFKEPFVNEWYDYYLTGHKFLVNRLKEKGVKVYLWEWWYELVHKFETIRTKTNGKIDDGHWSWKGHQDFFYYITKIIENNII